MRDELRIKTARELGVSVQSLSDISPLIGATWGLDGLILTEADLGPAFSRLRSGLAGELFQKLTNYGVRTALILPDFAAYGERFAELAHEHARHCLIRFVHSEEEARHWLQTPSHT